MNSEQLGLASELMKEFEAGKTPKFGVEFLWSGVKLLNWHELRDYEYSMDGVTWHPFSKEVEA